MAGDWIKMRIALADDPAVISIAARLSVDEFEVVGMLHHLWGWADTQSRDGHAPGVTNVWIDRYVRHAGFADAMVSVGWLDIDDSGVTFPKFDRHNGETAKTRALAAERKRNQRGKVTEETGHVSRSERDISVTREEKRREVKTTTSPSKGDAASLNFDRFWQTWPSTERKVAKAKCAEKWKKAGLDSLADEIVNHVEVMRSTRQWRDGYEPAPLTYLNQRRWEDGVSADSSGFNGHSDNPFA